MSGIRAALDGLCDAFNARDLDRIMQFFAEDCSLDMPRGAHPWGTRFEGKAAVRQGLKSRLEGLPDLHYGSAQHFADEDGETGISKWTLAGTDRTGRNIEVNGCDFYSFRAGKVIRKDSYWKIVE